MINFEWYRRWCKGTWHYNRYRYDVHLVFHWERVYLGNKGGIRTTIKTEIYD